MNSISATYFTIDVVLLLHRRWYTAAVEIIPRSTKSTWIFGRVWSTFFSQGAIHHSEAFAGHSRTMSRAAKPSAQGFDALPSFDGRWAWSPARRRLVPACSDSKRREKSCCNLQGIIAGIEHEHRSARCRGACAVGHGHHAIESHHRSCSLPNGVLSVRCLSQLAIVTGQRCRGCGEASRQ